MLESFLPIEIFCQVVVKILREEAKPEEFDRFTQVKCLNYYRNRYKIFQNNQEHEIWANVDHPNVMAVIGKCFNSFPMLSILEAVEVFITTTIITNTIITSTTAIIIFIHIYLFFLNQHCSVKTFLLQLNNEEVLIKIYHFRFLVGLCIKHFDEV